MLRLTVETRHYRLHEPFAIARGVQTQTPAVVVTLVDADGRRGRGEGCGVDYAGETPETITAQIEGVRARIEAHPSRDGLLDILPEGGARCALDAALWDLEAKRTGRSAFELAGVSEPQVVSTAYTIGIRAIAAYEDAARAHDRYALLKIKVDAHDPVAAVEAVRRGAPNARFIVDPNQSWSIAQLKAFAPRLAELGVVLLEQPIPVGAEAGLDGYRCPVLLCADELVQGVPDLARAQNRFDVINIKLDKSGGLTAGLWLAQAALAAGFELMVGCMVGSSLSMAPALILAQQCSFVDLDGPLLQADDWPDGLTYVDGEIEPPDRQFWG